MSSKRARRAESDRGRSPAQGMRQQQNDPDMKAVLSQISKMVIAKLESKYAKNWPSAYDNYLACPFRRRNPARYANLLDSACTGHGFKDMADLRDHIKRVHSDRYGCSKCKERYPCRDKDLPVHEEKHRAKCKQRGKTSVAVSDVRPEWMTPEEDKRYFKLDFRKMGGLTAEDQYFKICEAIWPGFKNRSLNIWSKPGDTYCKHDVAKALEDPDLGQCLGPYLEMAGNRRGSGRVENRQEQTPDYSPEAAQSLTLGDYENLPYPPATFNLQHPKYGNSDEMLMTEMLLTETQESLQQLHMIPQPTVYSDKGPKDSGYWSSAQEDRDVMMPMDQPNLQNSQNMLSQQHHLAGFFDGTLAQEPSFAQDSILHDLSAPMWMQPVSYDNTELHVFDDSML